MQDMLPLLPVSRPPSRGYALGRVVVVAAALAGGGIAPPAGEAAMAARMEPLAPGLGRAVSQAPDWVVFDDEPIAARASEAIEDAGSGTAYLLVDDRFDGGTQTRFTRRILQVTSPDGLGHASTIEASFDPAYATLAWHAITVTREGDTVSRLDPEAIEVSRRHEELDWSVYDSSVTALVVLDDIRVGDVIEYQYSVTGANPVFGGRVSEFAFLQWGVPVRRVRRDVRMPRDRPLAARWWAGAPEPLIHETDTSRAWSWQMRDVPAADLDGDAPPDWDERARIQCSEYADWSEVVSWALPLYPRDRLDPAVLAAAIADAGSGNDAPSPRAGDLEAAEACLRFIQEQIRYLSVAVGESSHRPSDPHETLRRRFGDCKDKAHLLAVALEAFGIRAAPALVNTGWHGGISDMLPAPTIFNHVIVRLELPDGRVRWVDATATHQGGRIDTNAVGRYGLALPLAAGATALEALTHPEETRDRTVIHERFISRAFEEPAVIQVESAYHGAAADRMRARLATTTHADIARAFLEFYSQTYPEIEAVEPHAFDDLRRENVLTLREHYRVTGFWERHDPAEPFLATLYPDAVSDEIQRPSKTMRRSPFRIRHPVQIEQVTELELPEPWDSPRQQSSIENPWFAVRMSSSGTASGFTYTSRYESRASSVPAGEVPAYTKDVERAHKRLGWELTYKPAAAAASSEDNADAIAFGPYSAVRIVVALGIAALWTGAFLLLAWRRGPPPLPGGAGPTGLGGWLIVVLLALLWRTGATAVSLVEGAPAYFQPGVLEAASAGSTGALLALLRLGMAVSGTLALGMVVNGIIALPCFLSRHRATRRLLICGLAITVLAMAADLVFALLLAAANGTPENRVLAAKTGATLVAAMIASAIWISYLTVSKRVANTFRR